MNEQRDEVLERILAVQLGGIDQRHVDVADASASLAAIEEQRAALSRRIQGHMNYFAVSGNGRAISALNYWARCAWFKWLRRRSNRWRLTWAKFNELARGLPQPRIMVRLWERQ